jgi:hypothetical protein
LHAELVQEAKDNAGRIGQICHDHADVVLASVAKVAALEEPSADLADGLKSAHDKLQLRMAGPMRVAAIQWYDACQSYALGRTMHIMVQACQPVAVQLERARKQAALRHPRAALDAIDQVRKGLSTPIEMLFVEANIDPGLWKAAMFSTKIILTKVSTTPGAGDEAKMDDKALKLVTLEQTPFGKRACVILPKIENEVLMGARCGLNRWFLSLHSGGDGAKIGRTVLRQCAYSVSVGTGQLGLVGHLPPSFIWRV